MTPSEQWVTDRRRVAVVALAILVISGGLLWRAVDLNVMRKDFLQQQGDARYLRVVTEQAHRGVIMDRNGEPLAISTPVDSLWANPQELIKVPEKWPQLAQSLSLNLDSLKDRLARNSQREFIWLKRHVSPQLAQAVLQLQIPGVDSQREYHRYYPAGEVTAHLVGVTNIDDAGQEGIELAYNDWLKATPGSKRVIKDRLGRVVEDVEQVSAPQPGQDLILSIDRRIQYLAYRELMAAVDEHRAKSGSVVVLDAHTGEVLAMVNQPSYNPNNRNDRDSAHLRNRAMTDVFEPGSTIKPFTVAAALGQGQFTPKSVIDTAPGLLRVGRKTIHDERNYGVIDVSTIIQKSSNVGASKMALSIPSKALWQTLSKVGFGFDSGSGFPGEAMGTLSNYSNWSKLERATLSFGYGLSVTALQLARAYTVFANDGVLLPITLIRKASQPDQMLPEPQRVMSKATARAVRHMLERVVEKGGTGTRAQVRGYRIAGKTGTAKVSGPGGYTGHKYNSVFAGMAPASDPRLVMVVVINEPQGKEYYGGLVAAPVFARVMSGALRLLDIAPDDLPALSDTRLAYLEDKQ
jgi:cell division protein FtsI (penicillin-binding protein 3)